MNLRAMPITGFVTDAAGNVIRSTKIVVKEWTTSAQYRVVAEVNTESSGEFATQALKPGIYDIFESGVMLMRVLHNFGNGLIPAYKPSTKSGAPTLTLDNYGLDKTGGTSPYVALSPSINDYCQCLQVESDSADIISNKHNFPVYAGSGLSYFKSQNPAISNSGSSVAAVTSSRFDVEYYYPNVTPTTFRYSTWRQCYGVIYGNADTNPIVININYDNLCVDPRLPVYDVLIPGGTLPVVNVDPAGNTRRAYMYLNAIGSVPSDLTQALAYGVIGKGDIIRVINTDTGDTYWGIIFNDVNTTDNLVWVELWHKQHPLSSDEWPEALYNVELSFYQGFSTTIQNTADTVSDRITVFEDMSGGGLL